MKTIPPALQASLASGVTTLCWCWRITRRSGERLGFTDHDRDLDFDGTTFEAASGFTGSELRETVGLGIDNLEVESALVSPHLDEASLGAGDLDEAAIEIFRVDWSAPENRVLVRVGTLGEVRRTGTAFAAEIRGLAHRLGQTRGRVFQAACDAELGDPRCGVPLTGPAFRREGSVLAVSGDRQLTVSGLDGVTDGFFSRGLLNFTSGANAGRGSEVKRHWSAGGNGMLSLWQLSWGSIEPGDAFVVTAGCDKQLGTCRARFQNVHNFRGFPHMPGNDALASPRSG
jgi:uncharacterized phage protein (TIGR02218 family)